MSAKKPSAKKNPPAEKPSTEDLPVDDLLRQESPTEELPVQEPPIKEFVIGLESSSQQTSHGSNVIRGRVVLLIRDEQMEHLSFTLDSLISRTRVAKEWAKRFNIDLEVALRKLNALCVTAVNKQIERKQRHEQKIADAPHVSVLADRFMVELVQPQWHRDGKTVFSEKAKREIPVGSLWTLVSDTWLNEIAETLEGLEGVGELNYRQRLAMLRDALGIAAARAIKTLPEYNDIAQDNKVKPETRRESLLDELVAWLLIERRFTNDNGAVVTTSIYQWASCLEIDGGWRQCYTLAVWGRLDAAAAQPQIAVKGAILRKDLRAESTKKLAAGLREHGLAATENRSGWRGSCGGSGFWRRNRRTPLQQQLRELRHET